VITFDDGAHAAMIEMLRRPVSGRWTAELLQDGQDPGAGITLRLESVGHDCLTGTPLDGEGNAAGPPREFPWTDIDRIHIY
jgi:hypothetical protein